MPGVRPLIVLAAVLATAVPGASAPADRPPAFDGQWMTCTSYRGASVCGWVALAQRGGRVCGVQGDFATNAYYRHRLVGSVQAGAARIEKICGDPGSETDTYCAGQAPPGAAKVGWGASDDVLFLCGGRLHRTRDGVAPDCGAVPREAGLPRVTSPAAEGPQPEDVRWMASCLAGDPPLDKGEAP